MDSHLVQRLARTVPGDHVCLVFETPEEQLAAVIPFIRIGLERNERSVYIADASTTEEVSSLLSASGVDVYTEIRRGKLSLLTKRDAYLREGAFDPLRMLDMVRTSVADALAAGFSAIRVTGEMTWALGPEFGCDRLIEYETEMNSFFPGSKAMAICQYHRQRFSPSVIRDVLRTHPMAIVGDMLCENPFYEPPDLLREGCDSAGRVEWMLLQLRLARQAEERLIEQAQQLASSNADLQQFAYVTSHDLREPLRTLSMYSQLLSRRYKGQLDADADQYLDFLTAAARRMESLVRDLLTYSEISGREQNPAQRVDMNRICALALANLTALREETGADIRVGNLPEVKGDPSKLLQLIQNLIGNALRYAKPGCKPQIRVSATRSRDWQFAVADNGIGISPEYHKHIFGIFRRLHSDVSGTGIGLAICQRVIEQHGGRIWLESEPGRGSTFYFTLPPAGDHPAKTVH